MRIPDPPGAGDARAVPDPTSENTVGAVYIFGPGGLVGRLQGPHGVTPECPEAKFKTREVVHVRRLKHLRHLPARGAVVAVIAPGFSPDHAWDDLRGRPRRLMAQVPARAVTYIIAFEGDTSPHLMRERDLLPAPGEPLADVAFEADRQNNEGDEIDNSHLPPGDHPADAP